MKIVYLFSFLLIALSGCRVGPDYHPPTSLMPTTYAENESEETFDIEDEDFFQWWQIFNDDVLNKLLEEAVSSSFDYLVALEQINQARAQFREALAQQFPEIDSDFQATRFRTSQSFQNNATTTGVKPIQNFFQAGLDAVWQIDIFGKFQRSTYSACDLWQAAFENSRAVKITVLSEVANTYTLIRALQQKERIYSQILNMDQDLYDLANARLQSGLGNESDTWSAKANLNSDRAALKAIQILIKQSIYSLGILVGRPPESLECDFVMVLPIPSANDKVPAGIPSSLLRRRPDILRAERQLASATEEIGVAVADLYPQLSLTGSSSSFAANPLQGANVGVSSSKLNTLFKGASLIWGIGGLLTWPVLDFGKRQAAVKVQVSLAKQAYWTYQKTVITALQEVEQALSAYFKEKERFYFLTEAAQDNQHAFVLSESLYEAGLSSYSDVLIIRNSWLLSINNSIDSQQALTTDLISIYKALGGDW